MGACVSVHSKTQLLIPSSSFPTKVVNDNNNKPTTNGIAQWPPITPSADHSFPDLGSKDEAFFDSQAWLESDCEDDDFMSVRGDLTPSPGNTPVHHNFSAGTPKVNFLLVDQSKPINESLLVDQAKPVNGSLLVDQTKPVNRSLPVDQTKPVAIPEPSPTTQKKRLSDLFKDSLCGTHDDGKEEEDKLSDNLNGMSGKLGTPYASEALSVSSDGRKSPNGDFKPVREKSMRSVQWCLPNMLSTRSYTERKKRMGPAPITAPIAG